MLKALRSPAVDPSVKQKTHTTLVCLFFKESADPKLSGYIRHLKVLIKYRFLGSHLGLLEEHLSERRPRGC